MATTQHRDFEPGAERDTDRDFGIPDDRHDGDGKLVEFAREYGWRAYAIPVLAVVTVFTVISMFQHPNQTVVEASERSVSQVESSGRTADGQSDGEHGRETEDHERPGREPAKLPEGTQAIDQLPPGGAYTEAGQGTFTEVGTPGASGGAGQEMVVRYVVEVEDGVNTSAYGGPDAFSAMVDATLLDPRSWTNDPRFRFEHVTSADEPTLRIRLSSVATTREMCGGDLGLETSCRTRITGDDAVVVNESRWVRGAAPFEGDIGRYRQYLINHEVGHALGFAEHVACPAAGELAPIMMQQTLSLNNAELHALDSTEVYPDNADTCFANPWPYPRPVVL